MTTKKSQTSQQPHGASHATVEAFAMTFTPNAVRWLAGEPTGTVHVTALTPVTLAALDPSNTAVLASYRRDTNFAGSMTEAIRVIEFATGTRW